jgi:hypothetical protein
MTLDPAELSRWKAELESIRARFTAEPWPASPAEGLLATCRLSDDVRLFALAGERFRNPGASDAELNERLYESRLKWEQIQLRGLPQELRREYRRHSQPLSDAEPIPPDPPGR